MTAPSEEQVREWLEGLSDMYTGPGDYVPQRKKMALAALALLDAGRKDRERVEWQEANPSLEVVSGRAAEDENDRWLVYRRIGNVNDTEWKQVARGSTWRAAIDRARGA